MWISHISKSAHQVTHIAQINPAFPRLLSIGEFDFFKVDNYHLSIVAEQKIAQVQITMLGSVLV